jgi:hypothetical protein
MAAVRRNYQTVTLGRGKHRSPEEGACVIELATMLAGESFSDHCRRIDPSISAFLRGYNDHIDSRRRADLKPLAVEVIDSRGSRSLARRRAELCAEFARGAPPPPLLAFHRRRFRDDFLAAESPDPQLAGIVAGGGAWRRTKQHERTLRFIDELIALRDERRPPDGPVPAPGPVPAGSAPL